LNSVATRSSAELCGLSTLGAGLYSLGINGLEVLKRLAPQHVPVPVLVITGRDQPGKAQWVHGLSNIDE
jgi:DNA-binding NarL/FixJ family response regulator